MVFLIPRRLGIITGRKEGSPPCSSKGDFWDNTGVLRGVKKCRANPPRESAACRRRK